MVAIEVNKFSATPSLRICIGKKVSADVFPVLQVLANTIRIEHQFQHIDTLKWQGGAVRHLDQIDSTLRPFDGQFIIHGGPYLSLEGEPAADLIVVKFPDLERASRWYDSPAYQAIKPLRTANSVGTVFLVQGVPADHRAMDILA